MSCRVVVCTTLMRSLAAVPTFPSGLSAGEVCTGPLAANFHLKPPSAAASAYTYWSVLLTYSQSPSRLTVGEAVMRPAVAKVKTGRPLDALRAYSWRTDRADEEESEPAAPGATT